MAKLNDLEVNGSCKISGNLTVSGGLSPLVVKSSYTSSTYWYITFTNGYKMAGGKSSVGECTTKSVTHGLTFSNTNYTVIVSNASGKTTGNAEGVITGKVSSTTQISISTGYIDPNTSDFMWFVAGF